MERGEGVGMCWGKGVRRVLIPHMVLYIVWDAQRDTVAEAKVIMAKETTE